MLSTQTLSIINKCDLSCSYCWYETDELSYASNFLHKEELIQWFNQCRNFAELETVIFTGGEPTLHPEINEILISGKEYFKNVILLTNALTMAKRPSLVTTLRSIKAEVHVSLDHISNIPDTVRGGTKATLNSIALLAKNEVPMQITFVLTSVNSAEISAIIQLCKEIGAALEINLVSVPHMHPLSIFSLPLEKRRQLVEIIRKEQDFLGRPSYYSQVCSLLLNQSLIPVHKCKVASDGIFIDSDGKVYICGQRRQEFLGSIIDNSPEELMIRKASVLEEKPAGPCASLNCITLT